MISLKTSLIILIILVIIYLLIQLLEALHTYYLKYKNFTFFLNEKQKTYLILFMLFNVLLYIGVAIYIVYNIISSNINSLWP